jgi:SagB-type dehydrogenase family enzyme
LSILLPEPVTKGEKSLEECIIERESFRKFWDKEITKAELSQLFWAAQGKKGNKRTVPSAGAIYPLEIYATIKGYGLFHYNIKKHSLDLINQEDICMELGESSWDQTFICEAPLSIIICGDSHKIIRRYGNRGIRYMYIEVGHCAQNIHLEAVALGLGSVPIGAYEDKKVKEILDIPDNLDPIYIIPIGHPK